MFKIGSSQMLGKIRERRRPLRNFFNFHNKTPLGLQNRGCRCTHGQTDIFLDLEKTKGHNFCLKQIFENSTLKKLLAIGLSMRKFVCTIWSCRLFKYKLSLILRLKQNFQFRLELWRYTATIPNSSKIR